MQHSNAMEQRNWSGHYGVYGDSAARNLPLNVKVVLRKINSLLEKWAIRAETRKQLGNLSPRLLEDIGLQPGDALRESHKPFWRD